MADEIVAVYRAEVEQYKKAVDELVGKVNKLDKDQKTAGETAQKMSSKFKGLGRDILAAFGVTAGIAGFVSAMKSAVTVAMNFEAQMSKVRAISGATTAEMNKLEQSAKRLGGTTKFTATQVGELQEEYARLGFTTKEILAATDATLDLAAATGETLAASAQVAGATVRGFGLDASETGRVADVMALSFSKSALNLSDFAEGMKLVAPIARAANIPLETTTALMGKLADSGLRGSIAGTALKNLLSKLADENSDLSKELGFSVKNTDDLYKAFQELSKGHIDLTKATELTDERSKAAFITLLNGIDSVESLKTALDGAAGSAKTMADIMQDNFKGATVALTSAWEGFILSITNTSALEKATRAVTEFLQSMTGDIVASNAAFSESRAEVLAYKEELMGMSGTGILSAIGEQRDALADAENALIELRKTSRQYSSSKEFLEAVQAQELTVETLRLKFQAAQKALQDFRDRQNELGGDLAPTADELERMSVALAEIEETATPPIRSIALLSSELKLLKDELQNAEIGSEGFWNVLNRIEKKIKELSDAQAMTNLADALIPDTEGEDEALTKRIAAENKAEHDLYLQKKKNKEEFDAWLAAKTEEELQLLLEANLRKSEIDKQRFEESIAEFQQYAQIATSLINGIAQAQQQAADYELQVLQNNLEQGNITREEFDQKRRQILRKQAEDQKALQLMNAIIGTAAQVAQNVGNLPLALAAAALGAIQIGIIASQPIPEFADGVIGLQGAGTETSDSIPAFLSRGESVMTAAETKKYRPLLEGIRKGTLDRIIQDTYVRPAVDAALLNGFADIGKSAQLNASFNDLNLLRAIDRHRETEVGELRMMNALLKKYVQTPKRGYA